MARSTPCVRDAALVVPLPAEGQRTIAVGSPEWYCWLDERAQRSFAFESALGKFTARKERKQHGGWYWVAYRQVKGVLYKTYAGRSADLSLDRLFTVATSLSQRAQQFTLRQRPLQGPSAVSLLATKLWLPPTRLQMVLRPRLCERLQAGLAGKLLLLSAPAGFGKTTLLSGWLAGLAERGIRIAWVSLDPQDNDPVRFWSYLIAALNGARPGVGDQALALLHRAQPLLTEAVLTALINALATVPDDLVLALDDYQVIETPAIHEGLAFFLNHAPPRLHLALASRADPPFPLVRLHARGQCIALRADDLRFTLDEADAFLTQVMQLELARQDIAALEARTGGWIAGLQLAALSLQGRQDTCGFVTALSGSQAAIRDYLVEEVLGQQPEAMQSFLLQTSALARLSGPLCDAVTDQHEGQAMLLQLERANLFLLPLDEERRWYRYQPLFAEALRAHLQVTHPHLLPLLHQRAAAWYTAQGDSAEAIEHTLAIPDYAEAARLIGQQARATLLAGQLSTLLRWLKALPDEIVRAHLELVLCRAWALLFTGQLHAALACLHEVIASQQPGPFSDRDSSHQQRLLAETSAIGRMLTAFHGEVTSQDQRISEHADRLDGDLLLQSLVALSLGFQAADAGDEHKANRWLHEALQFSAGQGDLLVPVLALCQLAEVSLIQGQPHRAAAYYRQALRLAAGPDGRPLPIAGLAFEGLGALLREWNNLEAAAQHLQTGIALCTQWAEAWALDGYLALARVCMAQGDQDAALGAIREAERIAPLLGSEVFVGHVAMTRARLALLQGNLPAAVQWARAAGLRLDAAISAEDEPVYLLFARVLLARGEPDRANHLLTRLLPTVDAAGRSGRVIEALALQALAFHLQNATTQALDALERALTLAAPAGYIRLFVELGAPMAALLQQARKRTILPDYVDKLLVALSAPAAQQRKVNGASLIDPLTSREQEVLRLLVAGASNRTIAEELVVTVGTVKKHLHNIFHKLQAESRTQAIAAARSFSLV